MALTNRAWAVVVFVLLISTRVYAIPQTPVPLVSNGLYGSNSKIPPGYKSYSLFLLCDPQWLQANKQQDLRSLYSRFSVFGDAIGDKNAAIWFWKGYVPRSLSQILPANVDVDRNMKFCSAWHLTPDQAPYIVVTSQYPDEDHLASIPSGNRAIFALGQMKQKEIETLLAGLSAGIKNEQSKAAADVPAASQPGQLATEPSMWLAMLTAVQQDISKFGCAWSFKIDAGPIKADLQSCKA
jgi:hypothetical protein